MKKKLLALMAPIVAALALAAPSQAYLHIDQAQSTCGNNVLFWATQWFQANGYAGPYGWQAPNPQVYYRSSNTDVTIRAYAFAYGGQGSAIADCHVVGDDPGSVAGNPNWIYLGHW